MKKYIPNPIDTKDVELPAELMALGERIARNVHDVWARSRIEQGWVYGPMRNEEERVTPCLVDYDELSEEEKEYDRSTAMETLKLIVKMGYKIEKGLGINIYESEQKQRNISNGRDR